MGVAEDLAEVWDEAEARRGRRWVYPELDAPATALIVVGLTRGLLQQAPRAQGALARIEALAEALRRLGGRVVWARPDDSPPPPGLALAQGAARPTAAQDEFAPEAPRRPGDLTIRARSPSLFYPGASFAPHVLRDAGISTLVFAGGLTHLEVESSLRDAVCAGFQCVVAADCCLDRAPEAHLASLRAMHRSFADVRATQDLLTLLRRNVGLSLLEVDDVNEEASRVAAASAADLPPAPALGLAEPSRFAAVARAAAPAARPEPRPEPRQASASAPREAEEPEEDDDDEPSMEAILASIRAAQGLGAEEEAGAEPAAPAARAASKGGGEAPQADAMDEAALRAYIPWRSPQASEPDPSKP